MANTKQAQKMVRKTIRRTKYNKLWKQKVKSKIKALELMLNTKGTSKEDLQKEFVEFQKVVDKSASKKIMHKNKTIRLKKRMHLKIKAIVENTSTTAATKEKSIKPSKSKK